MMERVIVRRQEDNEASENSKAAISVQALHPVLARVLRLRKVDPSVLNPSLKYLIPPEQLKGNAEAADLLARAIRDAQLIVVVGDYDTDGATATALAVEGLRALGTEQVSYMVPDRFRDGYGLSLGMAEKVLTRGPGLVITVDNGISSLEGVARLREAGVMVVVTDHHLPGEALPNAHAIVNPNQPGCSFPSKALCGVGVMFYLLMMTRQVLEQASWFSTAIPRPDLVSFLDLVALGTVADVVPLDDNNRIMVSQGVARIRAGQTRPGIEALLKVSDTAQDALVTRDFAFALAPRLNASGRLTHIETGIECLLAKEASSAKKLAWELDRINRSRKEIERTMQADAMALLAEMDEAETGGAMASEEGASIVLYQPEWHEGVVGLIASRIKDKRGRPVAAFACAKDEEGDLAATSDSQNCMLKGSVRSVPGVHIRDVLAEVDALNPGMIVRFGGHAMAAGLSLQASQLEAFRLSFSSAVLRAMGGRLLDQSVSSDGPLSVADFDLSLAEQLREAAPWGQAFPSPMFDNRFRVLNQRVVGGAHLKLVLEPLPDTKPAQKVESGVVSSVDAIAFRYVEPGETPPVLDEIHAVYQLDVNRFRGQKTVQLVIEYLEVVSP